MIFRLAFLLGAAVFIPCTLVQSALAQSGTSQPVLNGFPFTNESLTYTVNWPSGLSLGDGHMSATRDGSDWRFELDLDASIPGFPVKDAYHGVASTDLCSSSLSKDSMHGSRKVTEATAIDAATHLATRKLTGGGESKASVPDCIRDALTFVYFTRRELGQGRVPSTQQIIFGALYEAHLEYAGAETITINDKPVLTDKIVCHIKGPASNIDFEAYFDRDAARTPLSIRVPLPVGRFSLELVR